MAEMLHISAGLFAALDDYVQAVHQAVLEAKDAGIQELTKELRRSAKDNDRWSGVSDHISSWEEDGYTFVGVRDPEHVEKAMLAEYGDQDHPPVPLFRNMPLAKKKAAGRMNTVLSEHLGIPRHHD